MSYDLVKEVCYEKNYYFVSSDGDILKLRYDVPLPYSPINSWKYNDAEFFDVIDEVPEGLEVLLDEQE